MKRVAIPSVVLTMLLIAPAADGAEFHVAPAGDDAGPGTKSAPFQTLEKARDAVRGLDEHDGAVTVWLHDGIYRIEQTFKLTAADAGTADAPVIYRAMPGAEPRLAGGRRVRDFKRVDEASVLARLPKSARGKVFVADLKSQGVADFGEMSPRGFGRGGRAGLELFFNGRPMTLARWPNAGWAKIDAVPGGRRGEKFKYTGDRPKRWTKADDPWVFGYWYHNWADQYLPVASIDTDKREITVGAEHGYGIRKGRRFFALNLLEELDAPGEWYLDRSAGRLYFLPPSSVAEGEAFVSVLSDPMVSMRDVSHVTFRGLTFEVCRGKAIDIRGGADCLIAGCTLRNIGTTAVSVHGGSHHGVLSCDIMDIGGGGISLRGGDRKKLTPGRHFVVNIHFRRFGRWSRTYNPAVWLGGVGNRVAHNLIHDAPHAAVIFGGNEHVIELNEVHHVCTETDDAGAFYIGRDWTTRGNIIRHNYFHDIGVTKLGAHGTHHVYLDDASSGSTVYGNIFRGGYRAILIGGGRDNTVENNIFIDCDPAVWVDARGLGWAKDRIAPGGGWHMRRKLKDVNYRKPPYSTRYPNLPNILEDNPHAPMGNRIVRNIFVGGELFALHVPDKSVLTIEDNLDGVDPQFADAAKMDFRLKDTSPAWKIGFKRIPVEKIGLFEDEHRR